MSILDTMILESMPYPQRQQNEGSLERQLNNVIDRGLKLYLGYLAADQFGLIGPDSQDDSSVLTGLQSGILKQVGLAPAATLLPKKLELLGSLGKLFG
jgi:hypothetical protein